MEIPDKVDKDEPQLGAREASPIGIDGEPIFIYGSVRKVKGTINRKYDLMCYGVFSWQTCPSCNESFGVIAVKTFDYCPFCSMSMKASE